MFKLHKLKIAAAVLCSICLVGFATGCGGDKSVDSNLTAGDVIKVDGISAKDLVAKYNASDLSNYSAKCDFSFKLNIKDEDGELDFNSSYGLDMSAAGDSGHCVVTTKGDMSVQMAEEVSDNDITNTIEDSEFEVYSKGSDVWFHSVSAGEPDEDWRHTIDEDGTFTKTFAFTGLTEDEFENSQIEERNGKYVIMQPLADAIEADGLFGSLINDALAAIGSGDVNEDESFKEAVSNKAVMYEFDKETSCLTAVKLVDFTCKGSLDGGSYDFLINIDAVFENYGKVSEKDVAVPDDVEKSAVDFTDEIDGSGTDIENDESVDSLESTEAAVIETEKSTETNG